MQVPVSPECVLEAKGISRNFGGVKALDNVDLTLYKGEVHAVIGENGAGKTTLMNIIGGIIKQDSGTLIFKGEKAELTSPQSTVKKGISTIHQELTMMPHLSVMENIFMGRMDETGISKYGIISSGKLKSAAREAMDLIQLKTDPVKLVKDLSTSERQGIEIVKALSGNASVIIMDEPNSSLTEQETLQLFKVIRNLTERGVSVLYVSHKIEEVLQIADRITILRDGKLAGVFENKDISVSKIFSLIAGREMKEPEPRARVNSDEVLLSTINLCGSGFNNINLDLHTGEVLGIYGLVGSGRSELARALFGEDKFDSGYIYLHGKQVRINSPADAISKGISMVPEDRKEMGLFMDLPVGTNMTITHLRALSRFGFSIKSVPEKSTIKEYSELLNIKYNDPSQPVNSLSGGNQQKVIIARNLMIRPDILILDEPTHGIDVGAREEIYRLISKLTTEGIGILFISSEIPEIISVSDRIAVLHEGSLAGILTREEATEKKLIAFATGYSLQMAE
jgi:ABC-type sugar transport system ATPase subunit